ncbi:hypothetical protein ACIF85_36185 [Streptomyces sp. NPDC086033]|jgi:hypothetical protein|uniref:hypothetical protein n=1 Tax=unclassified Streptomyces TaxID=2593676 RepID=UPI0037D32612
MTRPRRRLRAAGDTARVDGGDGRRHGGLVESDIRAVTAIFPLPADEARLITEAAEQRPP